MVSRLGRVNQEVPRKVNGATLFALQVGQRGPNAEARAKRSSIAKLIFLTSGTRKVAPQSRA